MLLVQCGSCNFLFFASTTVLFALWPLFVVSINLHIEEFHSRSFVPQAIQVSYDIEQHEKISYNMTIRTKFPGKILMNVFVRKLPDKPGTPGSDYIKLRNMDFCKTLESLRNLTSNHTAQSEQSWAFLIACPLVPGFYFINHGVLNLHLLPSYIEDGRYLVQLEVMQIYDEVTLLMNCKLKCLMVMSADESTESDAEQSDEYDDADDPESTNKDGLVAADDDKGNDVLKKDYEVLVGASYNESQEVEGRL